MGPSQTSHTQKKDLLFSILCHSSNMLLCISKEWIQKTEPLNFSSIQARAQTHTKRKKTKKKNVALSRSYVAHIKCHWIETNNQKYSLKSSQENGNNKVPTCRQWTTITITKKIFEKVKYLALNPTSSISMIFTFAPVVLLLLLHLAVFLFYKIADRKEHTVHKTLNSAIENKTLN